MNELVAFLCLLFLSVCIGIAFLFIASRINRFYKEKRIYGFRKEPFMICTIVAVCLILSTFAVYEIAEFVKEATRDPNALRLPRLYCREIDMYLAYIRRWLMQGSVLLSCYTAIFLIIMEIIWRIKHKKKEETPIET